MTDVAEVARFAFEQGPGRYLDREPLVPDQEAPTTSFVPPPPVSPTRGTVLLAARYTDFPEFYRILRGALGPLETGFHLRSLFTAADLFDVPARLLLPAEAGPLAARCGISAAGGWATALAVALDGPQLRP